MRRRGDPDLLYHSQSAGDRSYRKKGGALPEKVYEEEDAGGWEMTSGGPYFLFLLLPAHKKGKCEGEKVAELVPVG